MRVLICTHSSKVEAKPSRLLLFMDLLIYLFLRFRGFLENAQLHARCIAEQENWPRPCILLLRCYSCLCIVPYFFPEAFMSKRSFPLQPANFYENAGDFIASPIRFKHSRNPTLSLFLWRRVVSFYIHPSHSLQGKHYYKIIHCPPSPCCYRMASFKEVRISTLEQVCLH